LYFTSTEKGERGESSNFPTLFWFGVGSNKRSRRGKKEKKKGKGGGKEKIDRSVPVRDRSTPNQLMSAKGKGEKKEMLVSFAFQ